MTRPVRFGFNLPQYGTTWERTKELAAVADASSFDSVWLSDHFLGLNGADPLEAWTTMSAVAALTHRVELGFLVLCNSYRSPALLAKMGTTLDQISGGRLILGLGAGWNAEEYEAYGYEFPSVATRLEQLEEGLEIVKKMWTEGDATVHGTHYSVENARCEPAPTRVPHPPILVGGAGERILLRLVAQYADAWNNPGGSHLELAHKIDVLRGHCAEVGRDFDEIEITQQVLGGVALDANDAVRLREEALAKFGFLTNAPDLAPLGTPSEVIARLQKSVDAGVHHFIIEFGNHTDERQIRLFADEVIPAFR